MIFSCAEKSAEIANVAWRSTMCRWTQRRTKRLESCLRTQSTPASLPSWRRTASPATTATWSLSPCPVQPLHTSYHPALPLRWFPLLPLQAARPLHPAQHLGLDQPVSLRSEPTRCQSMSAPHLPMWCRFPKTHRWSPSPTSGHHQWPTNIW